RPTPWRASFPSPGPAAEARVATIRRARARAMPTAPHTSARSRPRRTAPPWAARRRRAAAASRRRAAPSSIDPARPGRGTPHGNAAAAPALLRLARTAQLVQLVLEPLEHARSLTQQDVVQLHRPRSLGQAALQIDPGLDATGDDHLDRAA